MVQPMASGGLFDIGIQWPVLDLSNRERQSLRPRRFPWEGGNAAVAFSSHHRSTSHMFSIVRWLQTWTSKLRGDQRLPSLGGGSAPRGGEQSQAGSPGTPQCGDPETELQNDLVGEPATSAPRHGTTRLQRAEKTLSALELAWVQAADATHSAAQRPRSESPQSLALRFMRCLQSHPSLIGIGIHRRWIQSCYEEFCDAEAVTWPPPYKDFARELARVMTRKRIERWREGERLSTATWYIVPDPAAEAEFDQGLRKRA